MRLSKMLNLEKGTEVVTSFDCLSRQEVSPVAFRVAEFKDSELFHAWEVIDTESLYRLISKNPNFTQIIDAPTP